MNVGEAIVKNLELLGVDTIFGGHGEQNSVFPVELAKYPKIKTVIIKNEQGAGFMACGYSMFSDKLGVCFATAGPGEFNLLSGLAVALSDSLPVLAITGYIAKHGRGKGSLNEATGLMRTPNARTIFAATTKKSWIIEDPSETCDILEQAVNLAFEGRPGPVHIHVPEDVFVAEVKNFRPIKLTIKPVLPDAKKIGECADILAKALNAKEDVVAILGYGAIRSHAEQEILHFVEKFQIPFFQTMDAKGILNEDHPLAAGCLGTTGDPGAKKYFRQCKVVLGIGNSLSQNATFLCAPNLFDGKILLHINIDPNEIGKVYKTDVAVVSDVKPAIVALTEALSKKVGAVAPKKVEKELFCDVPIEYHGSKIHPAMLVKEISKHLPENSFLFVDAGCHMMWMHLYSHLNRNQIFQNPGSFGPMASQVNAAIGLKCARPERPMICATGDASYLMAGFELLSAVQNKIPVVWVIFNNGEFNAIKYYQTFMHNTHAYIGFTNPDYVTYAKACGAKGYRVEKLSDFEKVFKEAISLNEPVLIDVVVDNEVFPAYDMSY